jgi:hypothetical protein
VLKQLTRLVIGGALIGVDGLRRKMGEWEASRQKAAPALPSPQGDEDARQRLRYAVIGAIFALEDQTGRTLQRTGRAMNTLAGLADVVVGPLYRSRWMSPVRSSLDDLEARGQSIVEDWIASGRSEDALSRALAHEAVHERIDNAIEYLTGNEEVQELVQSQSAGLVDGVINEARERTLSADNFIEMVVRSVLRRRPRWELPEPPKTIKEQAPQPRFISGKSVKK